MNRFSTVLARRRAQHRELRRFRATDRAMARALATAPTLESAHELRALAPAPVQGPAASL